MKPPFRLGLPDLRPDYCAAARAINAPIMVSAGALSKTWSAQARSEDKPFPGFSQPSEDGRLDGLDIALDSAGYVAAKKWGGFIFDEKQYLSLAMSFPKLAFWSSMDLCVEHDIAFDYEELLYRLARNAKVYDKLCHLADLEGFDRPMPVLQGTTPDDYCISLDLLFDRPDKDIPKLVGVGSMCRRPTGGIDGLFSVVEKLETLLPSETKVHLFGVKSDALPYLASSSLFGSADSMAWSFAMRCEHRTGKTNSLSRKFMTAFFEKQLTSLQNPKPMPRADMLPFPQNRSLAFKSEKYRQTLQNTLMEARYGEIDPEQWNFRRAVGSLSDLYHQVEVSAAAA